MSTHRQSLNAAQVLNGIANALSKVFCGEAEVRDVALTNSVVFTCTSLSLTREKEHACLEDSSPHHDRKRAEDHAIHLLNRPLVLSGALDEILAHTADTLRRNILSSLAQLVDSRLHVYTDLLTRHAAVASSHQPRNKEDVASQWAIQEKALRILDKGAQVEAAALRTQFECREQSVEATSTSVAAALHFIVSMDLVVPSRNGTTTLTAVSFHTSGSIRGTFSEVNHPLESVVIDLDTRELLAQMVQQAAHAVTAIVDLAGHEVKLPRSASFLAMPPPALPVPVLHRKKETVQFSTIPMSGLELLCSAAASELPVVSPHLGPVVIDDLEEDFDEDVSNLSVDQCADIIDVCLFGEQAVFPEGPPSKRAKIEDYPS